MARLSTTQRPSTATLGSGAPRSGPGHAQSEARVAVTEPSLDSVPAVFDLHYSALQQRVNVARDNRKHLLDVLARLRRSLQEVETTVACGELPTFGLRHHPVLRSHVDLVADDRIDRLAWQQLLTQLVKPLVEMLKRLTVGNVVYQNRSHRVSVVRPGNGPGDSEQ